MNFQVQNDYSLDFSPPQCWKARSWVCRRKTLRRRRLPADSGGVEMTSWNLVTYSKRCLRQRANYRGKKTLVFLMIADGTGKCQQTPELNKDRARSTFGFLCSASCLKLLFHCCSTRRKGFFFFFSFFFSYMWGVFAYFLFFFIMSQIGSTLRSTLFGLVMKCTNVQSY